MARLPQPGKDSGTWGEILNDYLLQTLTAEGALKNGSVTTASIAPNAVVSDTIQDGSIGEAKFDNTVLAKLNAVGSGNVADGTITNDKIALNAGIDQSKIANLSDDLAAKANVNDVETLEAAMSVMTNEVETRLKLMNIRHTIYVGPSEICKTIPEALKEITKYSSQYIFDRTRLSAPMMQIRLRSGFVMRHPVFIVQQDLGFVVITAEDGVVPIQRSAMRMIVDNNGTPVLTNGQATYYNYGGGLQNWRNGTYPAFCAARGSRLPVIKALFEMDDSEGEGTVGVYIFENSGGVIFRDCGVKNSGWRGLYVDGGWCYARDSVWDYSGLVGAIDDVEGASPGIRCSNNSLVNVRGASAKHCYHGMYSGSYVAMGEANVSYAVKIGLGVQTGGRCGAGGLIANDCGEYGIYIDGGEIHARPVIIHLQIQ